MSGTKWLVIGLELAACLIIAGVMFWLVQGSGLTPLISTLVPTLSPRLAQIQPTAIVWPTLITPSPTVPPTKTPVVPTLTYVVPTDTPLPQPSATDTAIPVTPNTPGPTRTPKDTSTPVPLTPGQGTPYTVQSGDTFSGIARRYNVSVSALSAANPGVNMNLLYVGQVLLIPGDGYLAPTATASVPSDTRTPVPPTNTRTPIPPTGTRNPTATATVVAIMPPTNNPYYITGITTRAREIFLAGRAAGNNPKAFALVGDSNTQNPAYLYPIDAGSYALGSYSNLQTTINFFRGSFGHNSPAAVSGWATFHVLEPGWADQGRCGYDSGIVCEYNLQKPSVALILLGTNDINNWSEFEGRYRRIIAYTIERGIIPILITKADDRETEAGATAGFINDVIRRLSTEYQVPLLDSRLAMNTLWNRGCAEDGYHYSVPPDGLSAYFDTTHLQYGYTMRNLTSLQALDAVRRQVMYDVP